jgi:hypothetical protein
VSFREGQLKGFDLTSEEHLLSEELINELQERIGNLETRKDGALMTACRPQAYEPPTFTVTIGDDIVVVKKRRAELKVEFNGRNVVSLTGFNLDLIDLANLRKAIKVLGYYMLLDDLANI